MTGTRPASVADLVTMARDPRASIAAQHAAFTALVERFEQMAFATAVAASPDAEHARDACQEAFLTAWRMLPKLREPAAFGAWLRRLIRTQCTRDRRQRRETSRVSGTAEAQLVPAPTPDPEELAGRGEWTQLIHEAIASLPPAERDAVTLFYLLGEPLQVVARKLGVSPARAGKLTYSARLRLRRVLPVSVTEGFFVRRRAPAFVRRVQAGVFDEFVGEYRFVARPDHTVIVRREGRELVSIGGGQRNVLASPRTDTLTPTEFDGEARFRRNWAGQVSQFVYYEFGKRLGVARRIAEASSADAARHQW